MFALQPNHLPTAATAPGKTVCTPFQPADLPALSPRRRFVEASLTPLAFALMSGSLLMVSPARAQSVSAARVDRLVTAHAAKFAPGLAEQLSQASRQRGASALIPVIVQTDGATPELARALPTHTTLAAFRAARAHASAFVTLRRGTLAARLTPAEIARLAADPHTRHVSPDLPMRVCDTPAVPYQDYALRATGADFLQTANHLSGQGVTVAVVDTGIYPHDDLTTPYQRLTGWADLVNNKATPYDDNGHGTHVAGIVGGDGADSYTNHYSAWLGRTAPLANLVGVKVLDGNGGGSVSTVIAGIDWVVAHKAALNIRVLNLSVGHPVGESYKTDPLCQACERAWAAGITVVCAAGNYGRSVPSDQSSPTQYGSITSPGNDPSVITVGAMNTGGTIARGDDRICSYSSRGPGMVDLVLKPDLVAPGNNIVSLAAPGSTLYAQAAANLLDPAGYGGKGAKSYLALSGTSMAAPFVAGAAALLLQADPTLTPDTIKARLMLSASKITNADYLSYGAGYLNVVGALHLTQVHATNTTSPSLARASDGSVSVVNFGWGGDIVIKKLTDDGTATENFGWGGDIVIKKLVGDPNAENFGWGGDIVIKKLTDGSASVENFGWGGDIVIKKLTDYTTPQNFGWSDGGFLPSGLFGGLPQLPMNFSASPSALWNGGVAPLSAPDQTDAMSLLFGGD